MERVVERHACVGMQRRARPLPTRVLHEGAVAVGLDVRAQRAEVHVVHDEVLRAYVRAGVQVARARLGGDVRGDVDAAGGDKRQVRM